VDTILSLSNERLILNTLPHVPLLVIALQNFAAMTLSAAVFYCQARSLPWQDKTLSASHQDDDSPLSPTSKSRSKLSDLHRVVVAGILSTSFTGLCVLASLHASKASVALLGAVGSLEPLVLLLLLRLTRKQVASYKLVGAVTAASCGLFLPVLLDLRSSFLGYLLALGALLAKGCYVILLQELVSGESKGRDPHSHVLRRLFSVFQVSGLLHLGLSLLFEFSGLREITTLDVGIVWSLFLNSFVFFANACAVAMVLRETSVMVMSLSQVLREIVFLLGFSVLAQNSLGWFRLLGIICAFSGVAASLTWRVKRLRRLNSASNIVLTALGAIVVVHFLSVLDSGVPEDESAKTLFMDSQAMNYFAPLNTPLLHISRTLSGLDNNVNEGNALPARVGGFLSPTQIPVLDQVLLDDSDSFVAQFERALAKPVLPERPELPASSSQRIQVVPLFVGPLKSGQVQVARAMKKAHLKFGQTEFGKDGAVSWRLASLDLETLREEQSIVPFPIFHLTRHPLGVVADVQISCLCDGTSQTPEQQDETLKFMGNVTGVMPEGTLAQQALQHWVQWSKLIQKNYPSALLTHSESLSMRVLRDRLKTSDNYSLFPWSRTIQYLPPRNVGTFSPLLSFQPFQYLHCR